jgi:hypothetical protein
MGSMKRGPDFSHTETTPEAKVVIVPRELKMGEGQFSGENLVLIKNETKMEMSRQQRNNEENTYQPGASGLHL